MSELPTDWQVLSIGTLAAPRLGGDYKNGPIRSRRALIKMGNIARIDIDISRVAYIPDTEHVDEVHRLAYGDVLFNTRNTLALVGKVSIWRDELPVAYYNSNILRLEFFPTYCGDSRYFGLALNTKRAIDDIRALATGTTSVGAVYTRDLLKLTIPVPPLPEQRRISEALSSADELVGALARLVAKKEEVKRGLMQRLLTGKTRLPGCQEPWRDVRLGEIATMGSGGTPPSDVVRYYGGGIPWVSISDITRSGKYVHYTEKTLSPEGMQASSAKLYDERVVLYAMYASLGECALPVGVMTSSQAILGILPGPHLDREYLYYHLSHGRERVRQLGQQGTQSNLNAGMVRDFRLGLPPIDEQRGIANTLGDADLEIEALRRRLRKARAIKQGMVQQLLTGRTRLPALEGVA